MLSSAALIFALAGAPVSSHISAEVNGQVITRREVDAALAPMIQQLERRYQGDELAERKKEFYIQALNRIIEHRLLVQTARDLGLTADEKIVDASLEELAEKAGGWPRLLDLLRKAGMSLDDKVKQVREGEMVKRLLAAVVVPRVYASPEDLRRYYREHGDEFTESAKYRTGQIIVWKKTYPTLEEARQKIEEVAKKLRDGEDFAELARKHSDGPHAAEGGDWGFVGRSDLIEELADALSGMKAGEVKGPIESKVGFHLLKVTDVREPVLKPFGDVQETIRMMLRKQSYLVETQRYVDEVRRKAHVTIFDRPVGTDLPQ